MSYALNFETVKHLNASVPCTIKTWLFSEEAANFDLIITDQTMPEVTGLEMIKKMFDIRKELPVILCSGYNELISEEQVMQLGISKYLTKPVNNQLMLKSVQSSLK